MTPDRGAVVGSVPRGLAADEQQVDGVGHEFDVVVFFGRDVGDQVVEGFCLLLSRPRKFMDWNV